jgi:vancomycin permeability regulator SanA
MKSIVRWLLEHKWWFVGCLAVALLSLATPLVVMRLATQRFAAGDPHIPKHHVAIVLGAGVMPNGKPSPYLQRRLDSAVDLYKAGKADILLLSGDNSTIHYNEPFAMQEYAMAKGVDKKDMVLDYAGFNTYDSCYRAKAIFNVTQAIVVSQTYHLPRALWTCNHLGVKSVGVAAKATGHAGGDYTTNYLLREVASSEKAMLQTIFKPKPTVLGKFEPIDPIQ